MTTIRPATEDDLEVLVTLMSDPGVTRWWAESSTESLRELLPHAFVILVDGEPAGWLQYEEETYYQYPSVEFDIAVADRFAGRGVGPEALRLAVAHFAERGHHRFVIAPAAANRVAIRAYEKVGFAPVGILRKASRVGPEDPFEDDLMMDLVIESDTP